MSGLADELGQQGVGEDVVADRELSRLRAENRSLRAKYEHVLAELANAEQRADLLLGLHRDQQVAQQWEKLQKRPSSRATAIIHLTDWHVEETVDPTLIDGMNEFNLDVAAQRIKQTFQRALHLLEVCRRLVKIRDLVVFLGGDFISGYIHEELVESNSLSPTEACLFVQDHLASGLDFLLSKASISRMLVACCHGNHGRTSPLKLISTGYKNSFEWNLYEQMARTYRRQPKMAWKVEKGIHNWVDVQGHTLRLHHGDHIRYSGGVGGLAIPANKAVNEWNKARRASLDLFGHYHQWVDLPHLHCTPSLVGYNLYAVSVKAPYEPPQQSMLVIDRDRGNVLTLRIFCE